VFSLTFASLVDGCVSIYEYKEETNVIIAIILFRDFHSRLGEECRKNSLTRVGQSVKGFGIIWLVVGNRSFALV